MTCTKHLIKKAVQLASHFSLVANVAKVMAISVKNANAASSSKISLSETGLPRFVFNAQFTLKNATGVTREVAKGVPVATRDLVIIASETLLTSDI
jgi:hypothetical protein